MIEQLTDDARRALLSGVPAYEERKLAVRIIDAHAAERAALVAVIERVRALKTKALFDGKCVFIRRDDLDEALDGAVAPEVTRPKVDAGATPTEIVPTGNTCSISRSTGAELAGAGHVTCQQHERCPVTDGTVERMVRDSIEADK